MEDGGWRVEGGGLKGERGWSLLGKEIVSRGSR